MFVRCPHPSFNILLDVPNWIGVPDIIVKHLIGLIVSLAQLVSPSGALPAELVSSLFSG